LLQQLFQLLSILQLQPQLQPQLQLQLPLPQAQAQLLPVLQAHQLKLLPALQAHQLKLLLKFNKNLQVQSAALQTHTTMASELVFVTQDTTIQLKVVSKDLPVLQVALVKLMDHANVMLA
jgi:hypothetical protein